MENLDIEGLFWLPQSPDNKIGGHLTFGVSGGGDLRLIGAFSSDHPVLAKDTQFDRILGLAGQRILTLYDCFIRHRTIEFPGLIRETYSVSTIFAGKCSLSNPPLFSIVHVELDHLEDWVGKTFLEKAGLFDKVSLHEGPTTLHYIKPVEPIVDGDRVTFQLLGGYTYRSPSIAYKEVDLFTVLCMHFSKLVSFQKVAEISLGLQALVSIALDTPLSIRRLLVFENGTAETNNLAGARLGATQMYSSFRGSATESSKDYYHPSEMLFTFDQIGGLSGVIQWLEVFRKYELVVDMMTSHWYLPKLYIQNRFANALIASEAFLRIEEQRQDINYHNKIKQHIRRSALFTDLVRDVESWVDEIMQTRNELVIHPGLKSEVDNRRLYILAEALYFLVVILLLKKAGVAESVFSEMANHRRYIWLAHQLQQ